jgi:hypothetical protein
MAGPSRVRGPDGEAWTIRRRWFPWQIQRGELIAAPVKPQPRRQRLEKSSMCLR